MQPAPVPVDEDARLAAVRRYDVLDTPPDGAFDRITALAARICHVPISTITIVDEDRIWFKSTHGIEVDEIGRDPGLCASAVIDFEPYVVTDATTDARAMSNPLVRGELGLRFYVGVPLTTAEGYRLGTLNVIDVAPREISDEELAHLEDLAAIVVDELELRLAARQSVSHEAAREAAEFRETLMDGISHEMRTPISVLQGIVGLDPHDADLEVADLQRMMGRHVLHLEWLVNQYLDFTHLEAGRAPHLSAEPLDMAEVAREAAELGGEDVPVEVEVAGEVPPALASRSRTLQILNELLNNARRVTPAGATVTLTVGSTGAGEVFASVSDVGPGLTIEEAERAFERFYRGSTGTGSGIGLYVSRALAEAQHGRLVLEPTAATGARFTLTLPAADA
jgi:signal transduction histidine kinase